MFGLDKGKGNAQAVFMALDKHDPITNAIYKGIKEDIEFNHTNKRHRATLVLMFSAMDVMAFLGMPDSQSDVVRKDFIAWVERYIKMPGVTQLKGEDLYGTRCALLHAYSSESKMSRQSKCKELAFVDQLKGSAVRANGHPKYVLVSIAALKTALFDGIDACLLDLFKSPATAITAEKRLKKLMIIYDDVPGSGPQLRRFLQSPT